MDTTKAIELMENARHIGIILPREPNLDVLASGEALVAILEAHGKIAGLVSPHPMRETERRFARLSANNPLPKEFIISLDTTQAPVSEMKYEKSEGKIDIIFSPHRTSIQKEFVSFRDGKIRCDCAIALGLADIESAAPLLADPEFLSETPIINIDVSEKNKRYGEANIVATEKSSLAELLYHFLVAFHKAPLDPEAASLLLLGMVKETNNFRSPSTSADTLLAGSELLRLGANLAEAQESLRDLKEISLLQLAARAAVRSKIDERGVLWSFVTAEDFAKTNRDAKDLPFIIERVEKEFPAHRLAAFVWQNPEDHVIFATLSGRREILETFEARGAGKFQSPHLLLAASFETFRQAEEIVGSLIENGF